MKLNLTLDPTYDTAIAKEYAAYLARESGDPMTQDEFLADAITPMLNQWREKYDLEKIPMSPELEKALLTDAAEVVAAIQSRKAKEQAAKDAAAAAAAAEAQP